MGLHRILETTRIASILILLLHFYLTAPINTDTADPIVQRLTETISHLPVISNFTAGKTLALVLLAISLLGANGRKSTTPTLQNGVLLIGIGIALFFGSGLLAAASIPYAIFCSAGWLLTLYGGNYLSRIVWQHKEEDIFNRLHESFPQEQRLLQNSRSVNIPAHYRHNGATILSWINIVSPQRGTILLGSPGSGKTFLLQLFIRQMIEHGYSMVIHDFKYDDLSKFACNLFQRYKSHYPPNAKFYNIQFDDLEHSNRCNLLHPSTLTVIDDADEAARAMLLGLNMKWIAEQGDFFVESAISFVKALIWYLKLYRKGCYCSWPHVIELAQAPLKDLFGILRAEPQLQVIVAPFVQALVSNANEQLAGQIATATISLAKLSSPALYYILTGNDFTLDLNNPKAPKVLCLGNNPQRSATFSPIIAAYLNTINRLVNQKKAHPFAEVFEEFSTISVHTVAKTIATGRSNDIAVILCLQNLDQLKETYGEKSADTIFNTCANVISGQVTGETARRLSDRFGRTLQHRESLTASYADVQISESHQLEPVIPESRIATLSPGEFVGMVADTADQPIALKTFNCRISADPRALAAEEKAFKPLPPVHEVTPELLDKTFNRVRADVTELVKSELDRIGSDPDLQHLLIS